MYASAVTVSARAWQPRADAKCCRRGADAGASDFLPDGGERAAHCFHGKIEATGGFFGRGVRDQGAGNGVRAAST